MGLLYLYLLLMFYRVTYLNKTYTLAKVILMFNARNSFNIKK